MDRINALMFLVCLSVSLLGGAQTKEKRLAVTAVPTLFSNHIVFQPGLQYTFNNWAVLGEVGYMSAKKMDFDRGYWLRTQIEIKRFLSSGDARLYCSFQTGFSARRFVDADSGSYLTDHLLDTGAVYQSAVIYSPDLSFAPKIGLETALGKALFLDAFVGLGVRILFNHYDATGTIPSTLPHKKEWGPDAAWEYNQTVSRFHIPVGLRLGFRF